MPTRPHAPLPSGDAAHFEEPDNPLPPVTLAELPPAAQAAAARAGWRELMPVQSRAIPYLASRRDLMAQSRTGSGKTGAFLLPMLSIIDPSENACQALVLVPTRELAFQVAEEAHLLFGAPAAHGAADGVPVPRTAAVYGGVAFQPQLDAFALGAHLVVGTPGRILDHLLRGSFSLDRLRMLVMDEADRMLSMGFYPDMKTLQRYLPRRPAAVPTCMFSATFPLRVRALAREFMTRPDFLSLSRDHVAIDHIDHQWCLVPGLDKDRCLVRLLEIDNPASALIFCNTRTKVHYVTTVLKRFGFNADELSSDLSQPERENVLRRVHGGQLRFLVATDVAARGLDIDGLAYVFQYEPPSDPELYVHRAGRTGRAGAGGAAMTLISPGVEMVAIRDIGKRFGITFIERAAPTEADVETVVTESLTALLEARLRGRDRLEVERMRRFMPLARALAAQSGEISLLAMLLDDAYHAAKHLDGEKAPVPGDGQGGGKPPARARRDPWRGRANEAEMATPSPSGRTGGGRRPSRRVSKK